MGGGKEGQWELQREVDGEGSNDQINKQKKYAAKPRWRRWRFRAVQTPASGSVASVSSKRHPELSLARTGHVSIAARPATRSSRRIESHRARCAGHATVGVREP